MISGTLRCRCGIVAFRLIAFRLIALRLIAPQLGLLQSPNRNRTKVRVRVRVTVRVNIRRETKLGEMRRHLSYTYLRSAKKWYRKNDERQNKACQRSKKTIKQVNRTCSRHLCTSAMHDITRKRICALLEKKKKKSRRCWSAYQKRLGKMEPREMRLGEMQRRPRTCALCTRGSLFHDSRPNDSGTKLFRFSDSVR